MDQVPLAQSDALQEDKVPPNRPALNEEIAALHREKDEYGMTIQTLRFLAQQEDNTLREKASRLERELSPAELQKYKIIQTRDLEDHIQYLHSINTQLSNDITTSLCKKRNLLADVEELQTLVFEADKKLRECEALNASRREATKGFTRYTHTKVLDIYNSANVCQV